MSNKDYKMFVADFMSQCEAIEFDTIEDELDAELLAIEASL